MLNYFYAAAFFILLVAIIALLIYYNYLKPKYTRERFAYESVRLFIGLVGALGGLLFIQQNYIDWIIIWLNSKYNLSLPQYQQFGSTESVLIYVTTVVIYYFLVIRLYWGWNGLKSTRQNDMEEAGERQSLISDYQFYRLHKNDIQFFDKKADQKRDVFSEISEDNRPWHIKAITLLKLYDQQYEFDEERDWHREFDTYVGRYAANGKKIGVICCQDYVNPETLSLYFQYINSMSGDFHAHIIIHSIDGSKTQKNLGGIDFMLRYQDEVLSDLVNFSDYKRIITRVFDEDTLPGSDLKLSDIYVPLCGELKGANEQNNIIVEDKIKDVEKFILNWVLENKPQEHLVLLGEYGQGKTVLTLKIVKEILQSSEVFERIPIVVSLRGYSPRTGDELDLLGKWAKQFGGKAQSLFELHQAGLLLLILDGFDEMDLVGDTEMLFQHFNQLWALAKSSKSKIILTGRPNLFFDDVERRDALGIVSPRIHLPYSKVIKIDPLDADQINQALRRSHPRTRAEILHSVNLSKGGGSFMELLTRPSTLYQTSIIWDNELVQYKGRLNSATVIRKFIDKTYERQAAKNANFLTAYERSFFMMGIALCMALKNQYKNQVRERDLREFVETLWRHFPPAFPPFRDAQEGVQPLSFLPKRLEGNQNKLETILRDVLAGGIIVQDLSGRDMFRFAHKSFLEYLISSFYTDHLLKKELEKNRLMIVNYLEKAINYQQDKLTISADIENFISEQIVSQVELFDNESTALPINGNENRFQRAVFNKINPNWYGKTFPNASGWILLHPVLGRILAIFAINIMFVSMQFFSIINLGSTFMIVAAGSYIITLWLLFESGLNLDFHTQEEAEVKNSIYCTYMRLYAKCSDLMKRPAMPLKRYFKAFIDLSEQSSFRKDFVFQYIGFCAYVSLTVYLLEFFIGVFTHLDTNQVRAIGIKYMHLSESATHPIRANAYYLILTVFLVTLGVGFSGVNFKPKIISRLIAVALMLCGGFFSLAFLLYTEVGDYDRVSFFFILPICFLYVFMANSFSLFFFVLFSRHGTHNYKITFLTRYQAAVTNIQSKLLGKFRTSFAITASIFTAMSIVLIYTNINNTASINFRLLLAALTLLMVIVPVVNLAKAIINLPKQLENLGSNNI